MSWRDRWERFKGLLAALHYLAAVVLLIAGLASLFGAFGVEVTHGDSALLLVIALLCKEAGEKWQEEFDEYVSKVRGRP